MSELFARGVSNLDIWRPESAKLLPKNDSVVFSIKKKRDTAGAPVSGSSGVQSSGSSNHPALLSLGSVVSAQQQPNIAYAARSLGGNAELTK